MPGSLRVFLPFVYSGQEEGNGLLCLSQSPDSRDRESGEQGNLDSSEQEGLSYIAAASAQFQGTNFIDYLIVIPSIAQRGQQSTCIPYQEKIEYAMSHRQQSWCMELKEKNMAIASISCIFWSSLCSCGMGQLGQHSSLGSCWHPQKTQILHTHHSLSLKKAANNICYILLNHEFL